MGRVRALVLVVVGACGVRSMAQEAYVKASNTDAMDYFGRCGGAQSEYLGSCIAISADGKTLAVGASTEASAATGINGNQADNSAADAGAVYVFGRTGTTWSQQAYVKASNTDPGDVFGWSLALSADGTTLAVGAYGEASAATGIDGNQADNSAFASGAVYVFARTGTTWNQQAYVKASNPHVRDAFGWSVALSADGNTLASGAPYESSAAIGIDGNQADTSATNAGAAYLFARTGTMWSQQAYVKASNTDTGDFFGASVALSADGATLAVGAEHEASAATGIDGNQADNSAPSAGAVYVFARASTTWSQQAYVKASNTDAGDSFGTSVTVSGNGATLAVGASLEASAATGIGGNQADNSAPGAGAVYVFTRSGATWSQRAYVKASNTIVGSSVTAESFGGSVGLSPDGAALAAGAIGESSAATGINGNQADNSALAAGAVYLFTQHGASWKQQAYIKASNTEAGDQFGAGVTLSNDVTLAVGASQEASAATGIDGNEADNSAPGAGAVYVFH